MRVLSRNTLREFWEKHRDVEGELKAWFAEAERAQWKKPQDILDRYRTADILPGNRVVFNLKGNHYRLVVKIHYNTSTVYIRFVGTHREYDRINAETV
jgi:mRNA interferase HigB